MQADADPVRRPDKERPEEDGVPSAAHEADESDEAPVGPPEETNGSGKGSASRRGPRVSTMGSRPDTSHMSTDDIEAFLAHAREALLAEGFYETPFQYRKKGQVFGVVKDHGHDLQLHVRAFDTGVIESEVELSHRYVEHLVSPRRSAHAEIKAIFEKHGLDTETINEEFQTRTGSLRERMPRTRTKTSDLVKAGLGMAGAIGAVAVARFVQRGPKKRSRRGRR